MRSQQTNVASQSKYRRAYPFCFLILLSAVLSYAIEFFSDSTLPEERASRFKTQRPINSSFADKPMISVKLPQSYVELQKNQTSVRMNASAVTRSAMSYDDFKTKIISLEKKFMSLLRNTDNFSTAKAVLDAAIHQLTRAGLTYKLPKEYYVNKSGWAPEGSRFVSNRINVDGEVWGSLNSAEDPDQKAMDWHRALYLRAVRSQALTTLFELKKDNISVKQCLSAVTNNSDMNLSKQFTMDVPYSKYTNYPEAYEVITQALTGMLLIENYQSEFITLALTNPTCPNSSVHVHKMSFVSTFFSGSFLINMNNINLLKYQKYLYEKILFAIQKLPINLKRVKKSRATKSPAKQTLKHAKYPDVSVLINTKIKMTLKDFKNAANNYERNQKLKQLRSFFKKIIDRINDVECAIQYINDEISKK